MLKIVSVLTLFFISFLDAKIEIDIYSCYGNENRLIVEGRVVDKSANKDKSIKDGWFKNSIAKVKEFINKELKNEPIKIVYSGFEWIGKTDNEGYFEFEIDGKFRNSIKIKIVVKNGIIVKELKPFIVRKSIKKGIISDFDDTLIVSNVTKKFKLIGNTLFKNYKQRVLIEEMAKPIKKQNLPLFIVTGSPKQLISTIDSFLNFNNFQERVIIAKKTHGNNSDSMFNQFEYKVSKIERLIKLYPNICWECYGDSGEKDRDVYGYLAKKYPSNIGNIFIRDIEQ